MLRTSNNAFAGHLSNAEVILANDPGWQDRKQKGASIFAWDTFRNRVTLLGDAPWGADYRPGPLDQGVDWSDQDDARVCIWLAQNWDVKISEAVASSAIRTAAQKRPFHPVKDYLETCHQRWLASDKVARVRGFFTRYFGADPNDYVFDVSQFFLIGAVARIYEPGNLSKLIPILEGQQNLRKSTGLFYLMADETWFYDSDLELTQPKEAYQNIRGAWLIELPELDALSRADQKRIKAFFTSRADTFRPAYGRSTIRVKRQCVFCGTTNQGRDNPYLTDETGATRFKPIQCSRVDVDAIQRDRDLIWGEAVDLYRSGALRFATTEVQLQRFKVEEEARYKVDAWEERLVGWLARQIAPPNRLTLSDLLVDCFKVPVDRQVDSTQRQASKALRRLGWVRRQIRVNKERGWYYCPPGTKEDLPDEEIDRTGSSWGNEEPKKVTSRFDFTPKDEDE